MTSEISNKSFQCGRCREVLSAESFAPSRRSNGHHCRKCSSEWHKEYRAGQAFTINLRKRCTRYGITVDQFMDMMIAQGGKCLICEKYEATDLHIDHCKETKLVRGLLCENCNRGIGILQHDTKILKAAILYLENSRTGVWLETETV